MAPESNDAGTFLEANQGPIVRSDCTVSGNRAGVMARDLTPGLCASFGTRCGWNEFTYLAK